MLHNTLASQPYGSSVVPGISGFPFAALASTDCKDPVCVELSRHSHDGPNATKRTCEFLYSWIAPATRH